MGIIIFGVDERQNNINNKSFHKFADPYPCKTNNINARLANIKNRKAYNYHDKIFEKYHGISDNKIVLKWFRCKNKREIKREFKKFKKLFNVP